MNKEKNHAAPRGAALAAGTMPALNPLEGHVGVGLHHGVKTHLILMPGDVMVTGIEAAEEFAASVGGTLPTHAELVHMAQCVRHLFKPNFYYTCDREDYDGEMATAIYDFANDAQRSARGQHTHVRARAVRRVPVEIEVGPMAAISARQIANVSSRLIDQYAATIGDQSSDDDLLIDAGVKLGIGLMAAEIQKAVMAGISEPDGAHPGVLVNWPAHIKAAREAAGMTPDQLANLVGVASDVVTQWESGEVCTIDGPTLMDLCAALNVDPGWLLGADDA